MADSATRLSFAWKTFSAENAAMTSSQRAQVDLVSESQDCITPQSTPSLTQTACLRRGIHGLHGLYKVLFKSQSTAGS